MLILYKTSIKTSKLLLLFILISTNLFAGNTAIERQYRTVATEVKDFGFFYFYSTDTVKTGKSIENKPALQEEKFVIPEQYSNTTIDFQINSDITYLYFRNFVRNEAMKSFFQAWQMEEELSRLSSATDSLRTIYAHSSDDRKEELAALILKNESKSFSLNQEIPSLYEKARKLENDYWKLASVDDLNRFQKKISEVRDSLNRTNQKQISAVKIVPDTITLFKPAAKVEEIKNEQPSGISYKIQIGAFKSKVPVSAEKLIKKLSVIRQIENFVDEKGVTIYATGNLKTWKEAVILQKQVKQEGAKNPTIIAFLNGKKIEVNEAKKISHEANVP